jgi:hypothetical protein
MKTLPPIAWLACTLTVAGLTSCHKTPWFDPGDNSVSPEGRNLVLPAGIKTVKVLEQNWTLGAARRYYTTTQGSRMMPYDWFINLEQAGSTALFRDDANMLKLGYLARKPDKAGNPEGLPIGFVRDNTQIGLTCAACHTGQINFQGTTWVIDGAPTMANAADMMRQMEAALRATANDAAKFERLAKAVLGKQDSEGARAALKKELAEVIEKRSGYNHRNLPQAGHPDFGPGRIDAFGAILNEVAVRFAQSPQAETKIDAPVSYPFLWDTPQHDKVQWNGSAPNTDVPEALGGILGTRHIGALGRNIGEVLGVFGDVDTTNEGPLGGYESSVNKPNLIILEDLLETLWSPVWPDEFGKINPDLQAKGATLYHTYCEGCHNKIDRKDPHRKVIAQMGAVGTDDTMAKNVRDRETSSGILDGRWLLYPLERLEAKEPVAKLLSHVGQRVVIGGKIIPEGTEVPIEYVTNVQIEQGSEKMSVVLSPHKTEDGKERSARLRMLAPLERGEAPRFTPGSDLDRVGPGLAAAFHIEPGAPGEKLATIHLSAGAQAGAKQKLEYKARPLNGVWATAPYLHNGSVRNLDELLKPHEAPVESEAREKKFKLGSREFDPKNVGFVNEGEFTFDTQAQPGNSNAGHEYTEENGTPRVFSPEERAQLIEFIKSL